MEVKEAIKHIKDKYEGWEGYAHSQEEVNELGQECNSVISLLQDLEKYKEIVEDIDNLMALDRSDFYREQVNFIKQKYFPQPVKKVITIEVEAKRVEDIAFFSDCIKECVNANKDVFEIKVNIKEVK